MTLFDPGPQPKKCFVYCGDDRCNCEGAPRYRRDFDLAIRAGMHASLEVDPTNGPCLCDVPVTDARRPTHCHLCGHRKRDRSPAKEAE